MSPHIQKYVREGKSIVTISKEANYPPYMMARLFVEHMHKNFNGKKGGSKKYITDAMRDPEKHLNGPPEHFLRPEYWYSEKVALQSKDSLVRFVICVYLLRYHSGLVIDSTFMLRTHFFMEHLKSQNNMESINYLCKQHRSLLFTASIFDYINKS